jgi:hypothetical protein
VTVFVVIKKMGGFATITILCSETVQADLLQEVERLKQLISADLEELNRNSKI